MKCLCGECEMFFTVEIPENHKKAFYYVKVSAFENFGILDDLFEE